MKLDDLIPSNRLFFSQVVYRVIRMGKEKEENEVFPF